MTAVESSVSTIQSLQAAFKILSTLSLTSNLYPTDTATDDLLPMYDYIVVGGGSAGCIMANRLTEDPNNTVVMFEEGGLPALESLWGGLFPIQVGTDSECQQNATYNEAFGLNLIGKVMALEQGKTLGGTGTTNHMIIVKGNKLDYDTWVNKSNDTSWSYENLLNYSKKFENLRDEEILEEYSSYHGTSGPVLMKRQQSTQNIPILNAFKELNYTILTDINNPTSTVGVLEPTLTLFEGTRYTPARSYLTSILNRTNLYVKYDTIVIQILFDENNKATGVKIVDSNNATNIIKARKEVIISAGAIKTPQLLTLSGIASKKTLNNLEIDIVSELPVGEKLWDHSGAVVAYTLSNTSSTTISSYSEFPVPMTTTYMSLNSSKYPQAQAINLLFPKNSAGLLQLCSWVFKFTDYVCQKMYDANLENEILYVVVNVVRPFSEGNVTITSSDPSVYPSVDLGLLTDERDMDILGQALFNINSLLNTTYFKSVNSRMLDFNLTNCNNLDNTTLEYFLCYGKEMSTSVWHPCCTCPMGTVLNSDLTVKNTTNLRVVDASAMPYTISGNILGGVNILAEKGADMVKASNSE